MRHPFQCIAVVKSLEVESSRPGYLLAACGPRLSLICLTSGDVLSQWSSDEAVGVSSPTTTNHAENDRPTKKQKALSTTTTNKPSSNIIKLTVSPNNQYATAVTDDKCIRVFSLQTNTLLHELSSRCMPKRPCAIQILPDNTTILCGDKFGDVYSLPLLPSIESNNEPPSDDGTTTTPSQPAPAPDESPKPFKPSATTKTVHTRRNLLTLASQQSQKNLTPKTKAPLAFTHNLLLGHVSMLTDLVHTTLLTKDGKERNYIITADRDEHIRVSRAPPQAHVIEGYCLGHGEFVSKVCVVPGTDLLVSGGGDDWVGVWAWPEFRLRHRIDLKEVFGEGSVAVSGIWVAQVGEERVVLVACERSPILGCFLVEDLVKDKFEARLVEIGRWNAPIIDVASIGDKVLLSFDARGSEDERLRTFVLKKPEQGELALVHDSPMRRLLDRANEIQTDASDDTHLDNFLYGIENLRKRGYHDEADEEPLEQPS